MKQLISMHKYAKLLVNGVRVEIIDILNDKIENE